MSPDPRVRNPTPPDRCGLTPLNIGLGVAFVAGVNCDIAIETSWEALGQVLPNGPMLLLRGEPCPIDGVGRERAVYAPESAVVCISRRIGEAVAAGESVLEIAGKMLCAPIPGTLRGLGCP